MNIRRLQLELRGGYERRDRARHRWWLVARVLSLVTLIILGLFT